MKSEITVPCHWNKKLIRDIIKNNKRYNKKKISITETYGVLPQSIVGHGRAPNKIPIITEKQAIIFRNYVKKKGLKFAYLLNSPITEGGLRKDKQKIIKYLEWVVYQFKPDSLVIASYPLMKLVKEKFGEIQLCISTIARVSSVKDLKKYLQFKPKKVVLQHDANRNFKGIEKLKKFCRKHKIEIELMLTESCLRRCPYMTKHYKWVGSRRDDRQFHFKCNKMKVSNPRELLKANFIRPEDVKIYEKMGINHYKITGRSKKAGWLPKVMEAYLSRKFNGNIIRLLGIDPSINAEKWIYINNKSLNGFLKKFPKNNIGSEENKYCDEWALKLYIKKDLRIGGFKYKIINNQLAIIDGTKKLKEIYKIK